MQFQTIIVKVQRITRLDIFLTRRLPHVSRSRVQRHVEAGDILVDGRVVRSSHRLQGGEVLTLKSLAERSLAAASQPLDLDIIFEDKHLFVINKPAGLLVHPVGKEFRSTLLNGLFYLQRERGEDTNELGIVHRLDRLTSGLIVVAKTLQARRKLGADVEARAMKRRYLAFVLGLPLSPGQIDLWIRRDPRRPTRMQAVDEQTYLRLEGEGFSSAVSSSGYSDPRKDIRPRAAVTRYRLLRRFREVSLMRLQLETGRTHQIRVHMQAIDHPLLGDPIYGATPDRVVEAAKKLQRPALHAACLEFRHPVSDEWIGFRAPLPGDLKQLAEDLE